LREVQVGASLHVGLSGLRPNTTYEFRLAATSAPARLREDAVSFARSTTDRNGNVAPIVLWYQSGVVGCSLRSERRKDQPFVFRSFEEAERSLTGRTFAVSVHPVERDPTGRIPPMKLSVGEAESSIQFSFAARRSPIVFGSDQSGCLLNSQELGSADMYVTGRNFPPGEVVEV
jgi:hypothetical protein